jgi:dynein heavy chain
LLTLLQYPLSHTQELYDYDLPNIRQPPEALTAASKPQIRAKAALDVSTDQREAAAPASSEEEMAGELRLKNGDDAANFFARNGEHTPVKFVYLNRARTGDEFRPYDLAVVSRDETDPEYFTMSACGVIHVFAPEQRHPSEFIQLSTWMQQSTFLNILTAIRFFKHYLAAKAFRLWRANVRYKLYIQRRDSLCKQLFLSKPAFCSTLIEINALCYELCTGDKTCMLSNISHNYTTIEHFMEEQKQQCQHATKAFEQIVDKLQMLLEKVCKDVTTRARIDTDAPISNMITPSEPVDAKGRPATRQRAKSMARVKQEHAYRVAAVTEAQAEEEQLGNFVRLADYMAVSCCYLLTIATAERFLSVLNPPAPRKAGIWITTLEYGEDVMLFSPPLLTFHSSTCSMLDLWIENIHQVPRLLYMRPFKPHFRSGRIEGPDVAKLVRHAARWTEVQVEIETVLTQDFKRATEYAQQFEEYRVIHVFGEHWNFEAYAEKMSSNYTFAQVVQAFKGDMHQLNRWYKELERMKLSGTVGNLHMESKTLKNSLAPVTQKALDKCRGLLLQCARDQCVETLQLFQQRTRDLGEQPRSLREFADYCDKLNCVRDEGKQMEDRAMKVNEMYDLLEAYEVKVPATDAVKKDDLKEARESLLVHTGDAEVIVEGKMNQMTTSLQRSIGQLNDELLGITAGLSSGNYLDRRCDPKVVLEQLTNVQKQMASLNEKAEGYRTMQQTFKVPLNQFSHMKEAKVQFDIKHELWNKLDKWNEQVYTWKSVDFRALNVEEMIKEVNASFKDVHKMSKRLGSDGLPDPVIAMFKESVEDFKENCPVMADLGILTQMGKDRHWRKLFEKLEQLYTPGYTFTMEQLLRYGVLSHAEFVSEVSSNSAGEFGLELLLEKIRKAWADISFTTMNHREQGDVFILGSLEEVTLQLEDSQVALQTILASRFVGGIRDEVEEWEQKLSLLSEILDEWLACQRSWMYLENIFSADDIQKQLPAEAQRFHKINKFFMDRMNQCADNPNVVFQITTPNLLEAFVDANKALDEIQKCLNDFLETKCAAFPRFYFLSNDELLEESSAVEFQKPSYSSHLPARHPPNHAPAPRSPRADSLADTRSAGGAASPHQVFRRRQAAAVWRGRGEQEDACPHLRRS